MTFNITLEQLMVVTVPTVTALGYLISTHYKMIAQISKLTDGIQSIHDSYDDLRVELHNVKTEMKLINNNYLELKVDYVRLATKGK